MLLTGRLVRVRAVREAFSSSRVTRHTHSDTVTGQDRTDTKSSYDAIIVGAGHNGLIAASYLQKAGLNTCVLERRHIIGGAAVTEEIVPGFKFSRASYLLSLLRPQIIQDLELKKYGLKVFLRDPNSYTPLLEPGGRDGTSTSLLLGRRRDENYKQIAKFSEKDAKNFSEYEETLEKIVGAMEPLLDTAPVNIHTFQDASLKARWDNLPSVKALLSSVKTLGKDFPAFYDLMTAPAQKILDQWFESEPLKATLATDSVIGAMMTPDTPGSGYVLLHHVMGELEGVKGAWAYVEGGMGAVSDAIANCARDHGASIFVNKKVREVMLDANQKVEGVVLDDGSEVKSKVVLSNATPKVTFLDLLPNGSLPRELTNQLGSLDYTSPVTKINVAVNELPNFTATPNASPGAPLPHHQATVHLNCEHTQLIHSAYLDCLQGHFPQRPVIEMTIPSVLDGTLAPPGCHVVLLFTQYTPYHLSDGRTWDDQNKKAYANVVFDSIERYAPRFKDSVIDYDILTPPDLEREFGLTGGNIFHGAMTLDQLYMARPLTSLCSYRSPLSGLYLCGSGAHPGGGVMGSPGRLAAQAVLKDYKRLGK